MDMQNEPVRWGAAITGVVEAVIPVLLLFGVIAWTPEQIGAVVLAIGVIAKTVAAIVTRSVVWAPTSVDAALYSTGEPEPPPG